MNEIKVTAYKGFSKVAGETTLATVIATIRSSAHFLLIQKVEQQCLMGNPAQANEIKKRLPFFTLTGNYHEVRQPYSFVRYNPLVTIDVDNLEEDQVPVVRHRLEADPDVAACFLTPKRRGFKVFLYLRSEYACRLRKTTFCVPAITYAELEKHHALMYEAARRHVEECIQCPVDTSGKDISRGFFSSYDPQAYLNEELIAGIEEINVKVICEKPVKKEKTVRKSAGDAAAATSMTPLPASTPPACVLPWQEMEFQKAVSTTRRAEKFKAGNRDNFLFTLGNRCYRKGLDEEVAVALAEHAFHQEDMDVSTAIRNAYRYVSKTEEAERAKENKKPMINQVLDFLDTHYQFRRNVVLDRLEFREKPAGEASDAKTSSSAFKALRNKDFNSIYVGLLTSGVNCTSNALRAVVDSDYAAEFNPFEDYFFHLPAWDGKRDYIGELAETIQTEDQTFWRESFRRWLVGSVACALQEKKVNQLVLILFGGQGKGKSSWISHLLPPQWKEYYHTGIMNPDNKDDLLHLSTRYLINMDEFQGVKASELAGLKRLVTQDEVTLRKVYDTQASSFVRRASFIASTNKRQCLQDIEGNRRFLPSSVLSVDYSQPVRYEEVYAQALALLNGDYQYWYEGDEIDRLNVHNELHRMKAPVEENLFIYFRKPLPEDVSVKWITASAILTHLTIYGKVQVNRQELQELIQALEKYEFETRFNEQGSVEYKVAKLMIGE